MTKQIKNIHLYLIVHLAIAESVSWYHELLSLLRMQILISRKNSCP